MMQTQLPQSSWELHSTINSALDQPNFIKLDLDQTVKYSVNYHDFSPSIATSEDSLANSSDSYFQSFVPDEFEFPFLEDEMEEILSVENIAMEGFEGISGLEIEEVCGWIDASESEENIPSHLFAEEKGLWSLDLLTNSYDDSELSQSVNQSLILPSDEMEIDTQTSLCPLLEAYAESIDERQPQLAEVIVGCVNEKASPVGDTLERVAFNLFQSMEKQGDYINQESSKNLEAAFKAFYEIFPYGRIPHFAANSSILEAIPGDAETIHVVDFDLGSGIQWPSVIEIIASQNKLLRLTSVKVEDDSVSEPTRWKFEETKCRLYEYARSFGLMLKVEETTLADLAKHIENTNRETRREWLAFNCMVNLPHMGSRRSRSDVMKFLNIAKTVLVNSTTYKGALTFGHGEDGEMTKTFSKFSSLFSEKLRHYHAMYESMECSFPTHFAEARLAMESLFLGPYVSSASCLKRWEEIENGPIFEAFTGLQGWNISKKNLMEAKVMVKEGETLYTIRTEGQNENEMILEWRGSPLVRVSTWM